MEPLISIIVPTYNESLTIEEFLAQFNPFTHLHSRISFEVIISDSSTDATPFLVSSYKSKAAYPLTLVRSKKGRAQQMNTGATRAKGDIFLFLHADTFLPIDGLRKIVEVIYFKKRWGGFYVEFHPPRFWLKFVAFRSNMRIRFFKTVFGDQALFVTRELFKQCEGFPLISMMEDAVISHRLKKIAPIGVIKAPVISSARRFLEMGILKTYFKMFWVMTFFHLGAKPDFLYSFFYGKKAS